MRWPDCVWVGPECIWGRGLATATACVSHGDLKAALLLGQVLRRRTLLGEVVILGLHTEQVRVV